MAVHSLGDVVVELDRKLELLGRQITEANDGHPADFEQWRRTTEVVIRTVMGEDSPHLRNFKSIRYSPSVYYSGMDTSGYKPAGVKSAISILNASQAELRLISELEDEGANIAQPKSTTDAQLGPVFIVHGQEKAAKYDAARVVEALLGTPPTILHEQSNSGRTIIEKFEQAAGAAGFALVLLTADDLGRSKADDSDRPRGRQNVVFELGFFFGALGRHRTAVLYDPMVELPNDINGLVYIEHDSAGAWRSAVAKEFEAAGYSIDWSALGKF